MTSGLAVESKAATHLEGVVFDMDGVLVDSHPAHLAAWRQFLHILGREVSDSDLSFVLEGRKRKDIFLHFLGPLDEAQLETYGKIKDDLFWLAASEIAPVAGVAEFITQVRDAGVPVAVATSAGASRTRSILRRLNMEGFFSAVVTGDEVREGKPDPAIYALACQRMSCSPRSAVAIEDAAAGVQSAKGAGMKCLGIARYNGDKLTEAGADYIIPDFNGLSVHRFCSMLGLS